MLISWLTLSAIGNQILLWIDSAVYGAVATVYDLFLRISRVQLFTADTYGNFAQRIYAILGVVMLFVLAYNLLKAIVNPDDLTKGDKSFAKVAKNLIISLVIIGLLPTAFDYAYRLQNFVLNKNIIGALFFGNEDVDVTINECPTEGDCKETVRTVTAAEWADAQTQSYGRVMAFTALNAFLNPDNINFQYNASEYTALEQAGKGLALGCGAGIVAGAVGAIFTGGMSVAGAAVLCAGAGAGGAVLNVIATDYNEYTWNQMVVSVLQHGDFQQIISLATVLSEGGKSLGDGETIEMRYFPFVSTLCGILLLYLLASFCLDLGVRAVRLAFLQLIAPIPIFLRAMPGRKKAFDEWLKKTMTTYFEVFVRVFLMYFAVYFLSNLKLNTSSMEGIWVKVIVIMGVIAFVKEAPKLLGSVLGIDSGNMKIGIMPKLAAGGALAAAGFVGAGAMSGLNNLTNAYKNVSSAKGLDNKTKALFRGAGSVFAATASGATRGLIHGTKSKNLKDIFSNIDKETQTSIQKRNTREAHIAAHPNDPIKSWAQQKVEKMGQKIGVGYSSEKDSRAKEASSALKAAISDLQDVWKKDTGWIKADEEASVLKGEARSFGSVATYQGKLNQLKAEYIATGKTEEEWRTTGYQANRDVAAAEAGVNKLDYNNFYSSMEKFERADARVKGIERNIQDKKADLLSENMKTIATYMNKYADVLPEIIPNDKQHLTSIMNLNLANAEPTAQFINDNVLSILNDAKIDSANTLGSIERRAIDRKAKEEKK